MEGLKKRLSGAAVLPRPLIKKAIAHIFCAASGFGLSSISFAGGIAPFGVSLAGGAAGEYIISSALGAAAGYLLFGEILDALRLIGCTALICFVKIGTLRTVRENIRLYFYTGITFAAMLLGSVAVSFSGELTAAGILSFCCEALIAAAGACFVYRVFTLIIDGGKIVCASPADTAALMLCASALMAALNNIPAFGFSPAHSAAGFFIMLFALSGSQSSAIMAGVCCGVTLGLCADSEHLLLALPLSGLLCGVCRGWGRIAVALCFVLSDGVALILRGSPDNALFSAAECVLAALVFVFMPPAVFDFFFSRIFSFSSDSLSGDVRELVSFRLKRASKAVKDISSSVSAVSQLLEKTDAPDASGIPGLVRDDACRGCQKEVFCWSRTENISDKAFLQAYNELIKNGRLSFDMLPQRLKLICCDKEKLCDSFNRNYCEYKAMLGARQEINEAKQMAAGQFMSVGELLYDAAVNITSAEQLDAATAAAASGVFTQLGFSADTVVAFSHAGGKSCIEVFCSFIPKTPDYGELLARLYEKTGRSYLQPVADEYSQFGTVLSLSEAGRFYPEVYICQHTGSGERFSGDTCESFPDGKGNYYVVLSDGMGRGGRAALDSVMTCSIMSRLMRAGFSMECAFSSVNAALMVKSAQETLSTLDVFKFDMSSGRADFYKAGASFSVIRKSDKTVLVERSSLPLGILSEARFEHNDAVLSEGDAVLIMSDGAAGLPARFFKELLHKMKNENARAVAKAVVEEAVKASPSGRCDDITVACVKL